MSNRVKSLADRRAIKAEREKKRCPKCKSLQRKTREYADAFLHICGNCHFPVRELKS